MNKMPEFYVTFARKVIEIIPEFLWYSPDKLTKLPKFTWRYSGTGISSHLPEKCPQFYTIIARRYSFPNFGKSPPAPRVLRLCHDVASAALS